MSIVLGVLKHLNLRFIVLFYELYLMILGIGGLLLTASGTIPGVLRDKFIWGIESGWPCVS